MDIHSDSGQSTVEWLALMAMLVALAGVLVTTVPSIGDTIVAAIQKLIDGDNRVSQSDIPVILQHLIWGRVLSRGNYLIRG